MITSLIVSSAIALSGCFGPKVSEKSVIDYDFLAINPVDQSVIVTGSLQDQEFSAENSQIFAFLKGAKQGQIKTGALQDPFQQHNPLNLQKISVEVLKQLSINPQHLGEEIQIGEKSFIFAGTGSEDGVEIAKLDTNPIQTAIPLEWSFTVQKIK